MSKYSLISVGFLPQLSHEFHWPPEINDGLVWTFVYKTWSVWSKLNISGSAHLTSAIAVFIVDSRWTAWWQAVRQWILILFDIMHQELHHLCSASANSLEFFNLLANVALNLPGGQLLHVGSWLFEISLLHVMIASSGNAVYCKGY